MADAFRIRLPALTLAAGSAGATGDLRSARYVAGQAKTLAEDLRQALKNGGAANDGAPAPTEDQIKTITKQLNLLLVKTRIALARPQALQADPAAQRSADNDIRNAERSLKALQA